MTRKRTRDSRISEKPWEDSNLLCHKVLGKDLVIVNMEGKRLKEYMERILYKKAKSDYIVF